MNTFFPIKLYDNINNLQVGIFEYTHIPRIGEWVLTPDNDGSRDNIWIVEMVVYFPKYHEHDNHSNNPFIAIHASPSNANLEIDNLKKNALENWKKIILRLSQNEKTTLISFPIY